MPIDITYYFNLVLSQIVTVFDFMRTRLVFRLGGVTFNMFTLLLGIWIFTAQWLLSSVMMMMEETNNGV